MLLAYHLSGLAQLILRMSSMEKLRGAREMTDMVRERGSRNVNTYV